MALVVTPIAATEKWSGGASLAAGTVNTRLKQIQDYINAGVFNNPVRITSDAPGTFGLIVDTAPTPTAEVQVWRMNGTSFATMGATSSYSYLSMLPGDLGNNKKGPEIYISQNQNAGSEGPSAGILGLAKASGYGSWMWVDAAGKLRIHTAAPTGSSGTPTVADTAGAVIGDQTSWHALKQILGPTRVSPDQALNALLALRVYDFHYKKSTYFEADGAPQLFTGPVVRTRRDWWGKGMGRQQVPALNEVTLHGYTVQAMKALARRLEALEKGV